MPEGSSPLTRGKPGNGEVLADRERLIPAHAGKTSGADSRVGVHGGSSPLTRGKRVMLTTPDGQDRLIPAHAGKTRRRPARRPTMPAHPRSRGENRLMPMWTWRHPGSSPLTRGKHRGGRHERTQSRLIPAHAGKTCLSRAVRARTTAHPRSRGENGGGWWDVQLGRGSSPLTRGKLPCHRRPAPALRLIPAHAGKTRWRYQRRNRAPAHPRSRGENAAEVAARAGEGGSSPLTRGKRHRYRGRRLLGRLIPAHAGKTTMTEAFTAAPPAHPRSRGENPDEHFTAFGSLGSSPLTRGKRRVAHRERGRQRLIPAHAGKTGRTTSRPLSTAAHPRSRGENREQAQLPLALHGSSPLTRGKRKRPRTRPR